ncbi:PepSY-like domain-containing protein [Chitinophagaceae bacterium 26-R-25]|nr:PepSY-like domain-containing protein [Chitinophagaceae bacterium 26-R-25]
MKLTMLSFFAAIMLLANNLCVAQVVNIPDKAKKAFAEKYPHATNVDWDNNVSNYSAKFKEHGKGYEAHFNVDGVWDNTETQVEKGDVPGEVKESFNKSRFKDWEIASTDYVVDNKNNHYYRYNLKKGIEKKFLYFDKAGKEVKVNTGI